MKRITIETIRLKVRDKVVIPATKGARGSALLSRNFTIISNNCWGGTVYESYNLRKESPTVGMFIMPDDFLMLAGDLEGTLSRPLKFICPKDSKWKNALGGQSTWGAYLIGRVGDVELHMLHYHDETVARMKWEARIQRINLEKLVFKLNDQNGCTEEHARRFDSLRLQNKVFFTVRDYPGIDCAVKLRCPGAHESIRASYEPIGPNRSFNVTRYLNSRFAS